MADDGRAALLEAYRALNAADIGGFAAILAEDDSGPLMIGTGPDDWWQGRQAILAAFEEQFRSYPGLRFEPGEMRVGGDGNACWIAESPTLALPDGSRVLARHSAVLRRLDGAWRLVSSHLSVGSPDDANG